MNDKMRSNNNNLHKSGDTNILSTLDQFINHENYKDIDNAMNILSLFEVAKDVSITAYIAKEARPETLIDMIKKLPGILLWDFCDHENNENLLKWIIFYQKPKFVLEFLKKIKEHDNKLFHDVFTCSNPHLNNPLIRIFNQYKFDNNCSKEDSKKYFLKILEFLANEGKNTLDTMCEVESKNKNRNVMLYIISNAFYEYDDLAFEIIKKLPELTLKILCERHMVSHTNLLLFVAEEGPIDIVNKLFNLQRLEHTVIELLTMYDYEDTTFLELMIESGDDKKIEFILEKLEKMKNSVFIDFCSTLLYKKKDFKPKNFLMYLLRNLKQHNKFFIRFINTINKTFEVKMTSYQLKDIERKNKHSITNSGNLMDKYFILNEENEKYKFDEKYSMIITGKNLILAIVHTRIHMKKFQTLEKKIINQVENLFFRNNFPTESKNFDKLLVSLNNSNKSYEDSYENFNKLCIEYLAPIKKIKDSIKPMGSIFKNNEKHKIAKEKKELILLFLKFIFSYEKFEITFLELLCSSKGFYELYSKDFLILNKNDKACNMETNEVERKNLKFQCQFPKKQYLDLPYKRYKQLSKTVDEFKDTISKKLKNNKNIKDENYKKLYSSFNKFKPKIPMQGKNKTKPLKLNSNCFYISNIMQKKNKISLFDQMEMLFCLIRICYGDQFINRYIEKMKIKVQMQELIEKKDKNDMKQKKLISGIYKFFSSHTIKEHINQTNQNTNQIINSKFI